MSGLEVLFMDGGVTVSAAVAAIGARLGFKEHERDEKELASPEELRELLTLLKKAHDGLDSEHRAMTDVWGAPLSLFNERAAHAALEAGVPQWALACVRKAQRLIGESAGLGDRADVYTAQLQVAERDGKGLLLQPVRDLVEQLEELAQLLSLHLPLLQRSRNAFSAPAEYTDDQLADDADFPDQGSTFSISHMISDADVSPEAPMGILRQRGQLGVAYRSVRKAGAKAVHVVGALPAQAVHAVEALPALLQADAASSAETGGRQDIEYQPYVSDYYNANAMFDPMTN